MNKILILVRGIPGSGKSTFANLIWNSYAICEADKFFYDKDGNYNFDPSKLKQAHEWCQNEVEIKMQDNERNPQSPNILSWDQVCHYQIKSFLPSCVEF